MQHHFSKTQRGFTLVETLVGITILLVAIVGPMTMAARGLQSAFHSRDQITAINLAQEAIEMIRWRRDTNAIIHASWLANIGPACDRNNTDGCGFDSRDLQKSQPLVASDFFDCGTGDACKIDKDIPTNDSVGLGRGFYLHSPNDEPTPFTRRVWIEQVQVGREAEITVEVSWQSSLTGLKTVRLQSRIFNHYDFLNN